MRELGGGGAACESSLPGRLGWGGMRREIDGGHLLAKFSEFLGAKYSSPVFSQSRCEKILNLNHLRRDDPVSSHAGLLGVVNPEMSPGVCSLAEAVRAWARSLGCQTSERPKLTPQRAGDCSPHSEPG